MAVPDMGRALCVRRTTCKRWHPPTLKPRKTMAPTDQIPAPKEPQKADCPSAACSARGMARIRQYYGVPAKRGMVIIYGMDGGVRCLIVGSGACDRLRVRPMMKDGTYSRKTSLIHPTWRVSYPQNDPAQTRPPETPTI